MIKNRDFFYNRRKKKNKEKKKGGYYYDEGNLFFYDVDDLLDVVVWIDNAVMDALGRGR
jgi:hypothetical protein